MHTHTHTLTNTLVKVVNTGIAADRYFVFLVLPPLLFINLDYLI